MKTYTVFAGVNGAGKSTIYRALNKDFGIRINVDEVVKEQFGHDWKSTSAQLKAGRLVVKQIQSCLSGNESFNQETTLTGHTIVTNIKKAKTNGFRVSLYYVGLASAELSIERVASRVKSGGHGIPEEDLRRRYVGSFENLRRVFSLCDEIRVFDNSAKEQFNAHSPLFFVKDGNILVYDENCPQYLKNVLNEYINR